MKNYQVILDKVSYVDAWCPWDEMYYKEKKDFTIAIICAFSEQRLKEKLSKLYPDVRVITYKEVIV